MEAPSGRYVGAGAASQRSVPIASPLPQHGDNRGGMLDTSSCRYGGTGGATQRRRISGYFIVRADAFPLVTTRRQSGQCAGYFVVQVAIARVLHRNVVHR